MKSTIFFATALRLLACVGVAACAAAHAADTESSPARNARFDHFAAGKQAVQAKDWTFAAENFAQVVAKDPTNADAHSMLGFALRWQGKYDEAFAAYDKALSLDPTHKGALHYSGIAYLKTQRPEAARANLAKLQNLCISCEETVQLAKAVAEHK